MDLIWVELSRSALRNNIRVLQSNLKSGVRLAPCVKANAYGHGESFVVSVLQNEGVSWISLNSLRERESLHASGIDIPALIMGYVPADETERLLELKARPFVYDWERVQEMSDRASALNQVLPVHVKVDTGMTRLGVFPNEVVEFVQSIEQLPGVWAEGLVTHFANSDERDSSNYFDYQQTQFSEVIQTLREYEICPPYIHCANSAVSLVQTENIPQAIVRPGLSLFGVYPSEEIARKSQSTQARLRSVLTLKTRIVSLKYVSKGTYVGYDCTYQTKRESLIAVLPMGYADGFDRGLSNQGDVLVNGCRAPVIGRVSMNMTIIDVTEVDPRPQLEQTVTVIGTEEKESILPSEIADILETNPYEVMARLRESLPKYWR